MGGNKTVKQYALGLLWDQGGFWGFVIGGLSLIAGFASKWAQGKEARKLQRREQAYQEVMERLTFEHKQALLKEQTEAEKIRLQAFEAASFQKGSAMGPFFQVVRK